MKEIMERIDRIAEKLDGGTNEKIKASDIRFLMNALKLAIRDLNPINMCKTCKYCKSDDKLSLCLEESCHWEWRGLKD